MGADADVMGPLARYQRELRRCNYTADSAQADVAGQLDSLHDHLIAVTARHRGGLLARFRNPASDPVEGLYLWGDTGRGKTWLMDLFYESLPFREKRRKHFHRFMADVHEQLAELREKRDPLSLVAKRLADAARVLCFDEFFVADIADAMILGKLFEELFRRRVTLVATSNVPPDELYRDGLQRARFLPAIALIKRHTRSVKLETAEDYRLRTLQTAEIYHSPLDPSAQRSLTSSFEGIAPEACWRQEALSVKGRIIPTVRRADGVVWFGFTDICDGPRSQADYIEIAKGFHSVLVSDVPCLDETLENQARRFIALVDEFYDRNVKLILSAAVPLERLYAGRKLAFEFRRTSSRLQEMQSLDYLARPHLP